MPIFSYMRRRSNRYFGKRATEQHVEVVMVSGVGGMGSNEGRSMGEGVGNVGRGVQGSLEGSPEWGKRWAAGDIG